jgi:hypothetical protein
MPGCWFYDEKSNTMTKYELIHNQLTIFHLMIRFRESIKSQVPRWDCSLFANDGPSFIGIYTVHLFRTVIITTEQCRYAGHRPVFSKLTLCRFVRRLVFDLYLLQAQICCRRANVQTRVYIYMVEQNRGKHTHQFFKLISEVSFFFIFLHKAFMCIEVLHILVYT